MARVKRDERYVVAAYELMCGFERAAALADNVSQVLKDDKGLLSAEDDTRGWDGDRLAVVLVTYKTLVDANRLDQQVRALLSLNIDFTYEAIEHISYGRLGPSSYVKAKTTISER